MKAILLVLAFIAICFASSIDAEAELRDKNNLAFDPKDPKWAHLKNVGYENFSREKLLNIIDRYTSIPQVKEFKAALENVLKAAEQVDPSTMTIDPDAFRTIPEVVADKGYPAEQHIVTTEDGYLLYIYRIPHGKTNSTGGGAPVLLSHGLLDAGGSWVLNYPDESLPYILADAGYDVWIGNIRGNKHGDSHLEYGRYDDELWSLSFDEQGKYDIPNTLDYIRSVTKKEKVAVVGHSQGCTQLFAGLAQRKDLADKMSMFVALAPAIYFEHNINIIIKIAADIYLAELIELIGILKFVPYPELVSNFVPYVCGAFPQIIEFFVSFLCGFNPGETNYDRYEVMCGQSLGMTSVQNMVHWAQMVRTEEFKMHDFGWFGNEDRYGQRSAPMYNVTSYFPRNLPFAIFYGDNDLLVSPKDSELLIRNLPVPPVFVKNIPEYAHLDFIHGKTANQKIYYDIVKLFDQYIR